MDISFLTTRSVAVSYYITQVILYRGSYICILLSHLARWPDDNPLPLPQLPQPDASASAPSTILFYLFVGSNVYVGYICDVHHGNHVDYILSHHARTETA